jgi:hypothetical protein
MPIKRGRVARRIHIAAAIARLQPFAARPLMEIEIVLPSANPNHKDYLGRENRAYIRCATSGRVLVAAPSAYALLKKIEDGWKYEPDKLEGLWCS